MLIYTRYIKLSRSERNEDSRHHQQRPGQHSERVGHHPRRMTTPQSWKVTDPMALATAACVAINNGATFVSGTATTSHY